MRNLKILSLFMLASVACQTPALADVIPPPPIHPPARIWGVVEKLTLKTLPKQKGMSRKMVAQIRVLHVFGGTLPRNIFQKALGVFGRSPRFLVRTYGYKTSSSLGLCEVFEGVLNSPRNRRSRNAWQKMMWVGQKMKLIGSKHKPPQAIGRTLSCPSAFKFTAALKKLKRMSQEQRKAAFRRATRIHGFVESTRLHKVVVREGRFFTQTRHHYRSTVRIQRAWPRLATLFPRRAKELQKGQTIEVRWSRKISKRTSRPLPGRYYGHGGRRGQKPAPALSVCQSFEGFLTPYNSKSFWLHGSNRDLGKRTATPADPEKQGQVVLCPAADTAKKAKQP